MMRVADIIDRVVGMPGD